MNESAPKVFVVDDEETISSTLAAILKLSGFDARSYVNPLEALEAGRSESPDLLISDVMMPQMSGIELAMRFKESWPDCKVLLFSGVAVTASLLDDARSKGHDFKLLQKPVHPGDLIAHIGTLTA